MRAHDIEYEIIGDAMQMVEIELDPDETVIAEAGAMNYMEDGIAFETKLGDGSDPDQGFLGKMLSAGKRLVTGESLFMTHFTNGAEESKRRLAFAAPFPGTILAIDLDGIGGRMVCQKDSFLCAALGTRVDVVFNRRIGSGFFGGEGFILQELSGDGLAFVHAGGTLVEKRLDDSRLLVDTGCLVGFAGAIEYDVALTKGLESLLFGGEGLFLAELTGTGTVWIQSLPFARLADRILANLPERETDDD